jgi:hypothetical protein
MDHPVDDSLDDVLPNCPRCLHRRELDGDQNALYWICECGIELADAS